MADLFAFISFCLTISGLVFVLGGETAGLYGILIGIAFGVFANIIDEY